MEAFDLIPSTIELADLEIYLLSAVSGTRRLKKAIQNLTNYDLVLVDPPPAIGQLSGQALNAATDLFVPMRLPSRASRGSTRFAPHRSVPRGESRAEHRGLIPTQYDTRSAHQASAYRYIQEELPQVAPVLATLRNRPGPYGNAMTQGVPVPHSGTEGPCYGGAACRCRRSPERMGVKVGGRTWLKLRRTPTKP
jgi:cellulose biosynthesis protein BcsQ